MTPFSQWIKKKNYSARAIAATFPISVHTIHRAIKGKPILRRCARLLVKLTNNDLKINDFVILSRKCLTETEVESK